MGFIARVLVGFIISIPITVILAGGVQNAFGLMLVSIVCTAGIGLVFWIPVWWLVGVITIDVLFKNVKGKSDQKQESVPNPTELPKLDYLALTAYIGKATASGMDLDEITRRLRFNGWQKTDIETVYQKFISHKSHGGT
jgi:hypothetical protein